MHLFLRPLEGVAVLAVGRNEAVNRVAKFLRRCEAFVPQHPHREYAEPHLDLVQPTAFAERTFFSGAFLSSALRRTGVET